VLFMPDRMFSNLDVGDGLSYTLAIIDLSDSENLNFLFVSDPNPISLVEQ